MSLFGRELLIHKVGSCDGDASILSLVWLFQQASNRLEKGEPGCFGQSLCFQLHFLQYILLETVND